MKPLEPNDPHELVGVAFVEGDAELMAECLVEEYLLLGWNNGQLMSLFTRPCFGMTNRIYRDRGHGYVEGLIAQVRAKWASSEMDGRHA